VMVVDAPCSGSGMFRKDNAVVSEWSEAVVQLCSERQQRILASSLPVLKTGGILLYSTCSYSTEENEQIADWLCEQQGMEPLDITYPEQWGIERSLSEKRACPGYRFYPHKLRGEGFFLAAFRKVQEVPTFDRRKIKVQVSVPPRAMERWLKQPAGFVTFNLGDDLFVFPRLWAEDLEILRRMLYIRHAGICVGRLVQGEIVPHHDLALSFIVHPGIPTIDLSREYALEYLRKGSLPPSVNPEGYVGWAIAKIGRAHV